MSLSRRPWGSWITLVMAASPLIAIATSRLLAPERLTARPIASPIDCGSTIDF
jgi:hypothetical protein